LRIFCPTYRKRREAHTSKAASLGGLRYPSLTTATLALDRIDFTAWLYRLHYHGESGAIARRTFMLSRLHGRLFHLTSLRCVSVWRPLSLVDLTPDWSPFNSRMSARDPERTSQLVSRSCRNQDFRALHTGVIRIIRLVRRPSTTACGSECAETARKRLPRSDPAKRAHKVRPRSCQSGLS
jgi:hypothetical protein